MYTALLDRTATYPTNSICDLICKFGSTSIEAFPSISLHVSSQRLRGLIEKPILFARILWHEKEEYRRYSWQMTQEQRDVPLRHYLEMSATGALKNTKFTSMGFNLGVYGYNPQEPKGIYNLSGTQPMALAEATQHRDLFITGGKYINNNVVYEYYDKDDFDSIKAKESALGKILADFTIGYATFSRWYGCAPKFTPEQLLQKKTYDDNFSYGVRYIISRFKNGNLRIDRYNVDTNTYKGGVQRSTLIRSKTQNIMDDGLKVVRFPTTTSPIDWKEYNGGDNGYKKTNFSQTLTYMYTEKIPPSDEILMELKMQRALEIL